MRNPSTGPNLSQVAISFGSNLGDRERNISEALALMGGSMVVTAVSGLYETAPMYVEDQPSFLNGAVVGTTSCLPSELLDALKEIEATVGRQDRPRNGPREIDLDIIAFGGLTQSVGRPLLPHPRAFERRFVLEPLAEIAPDLVLPGFGVVRDLLKDPGVQSQDVRRVTDAPVFVQRG